MRHIPVRSAPRPRRRLYGAASMLMLAIILIGMNASGSRSVTAQQEEAPQQPATVEGVVTDIREESTLDVLGQAQRRQLLVVRISGGAHDGEEVLVESGSLATSTVVRYEPGDRLLLDVSTDLEGNDAFYIVDRVRRVPLAVLFLAFVVVTVLVGRSRGLASLLGMGLSFAVIFLYVLPQILADRPPIAVALSAAAVLIPVTFSLSHGLNRKTAAAATGTVVALTLTALIAEITVNAARLTGYATEEAGLLQVVEGGDLNMKGLLLASIIIGLLGILDDITVSQAAIVFQLRDTSAALPLREIYRRAMDVGRDHIASLVNTLILVYTSSAMPLLLLFVHDVNGFGTVVNYEVVADEIVRTLVASIGLILAVPVTTIVACLFIARAPAKPNVL